MPAAEVVLASQHRRPIRGAETSPCRARNAPSTTATAAGAREPAALRAGGDDHLLRVRAGHGHEVREPAHLHERAGGVQDGAPRTAEAAAEAGQDVARPEGREVADPQRAPALAEMDEG